MEESLEYVEPPSMTKVWVVTMNLTDPMRELAARCASGKHHLGKEKLEPKVQADQTRGTERPLHFVCALAGTVPY